MKIFNAKDYCGEGEEIFYAEKPIKAPYPIVRIIIFAVVFVGIMVFDGFFIGASVLQNASEENRGGELVLFIFSIIFHIAALAAWAYHIYRDFYAANNTYYIITSEKACIVKHSFVTTVETVFFKDVIDGNFKNGNMTFITEDGKLVMKNIFDKNASFDDMPTM